MTLKDIKKLPLVTPVHWLFTQNSSNDFLGQPIVIKRNILDAIEEIGYELAGKADMSYEEIEKFLEQENKEFFELINDFFEWNVFYRSDADFTNLISKFRVPDVSHCLESQT